MPSESENQMQIGEIGPSAFSLKWLLIACCAAFASACSTFSGDSASEPSLADPYADAKTVELQSKVARLQTENARLASRVLELQRENEKLRSSDEEEIAGAPLSEEPMETAVALREPAALSNPVIDNPDAPEVARTDVPIEPAPRLTQPTFAATDAVFENEAESDALAEVGELFGVHLASYRQMREASEGWRKLQRDNPDELGLLEPRIQTVAIDGRGEFLRLIGGGFSSREKADALCKSLSSRGLYCAVSPFGGERLSVADTG
ncbi:MAG: SPOR domain-containing protein [Pseudomonadota bacterium]